jgi:hypothetical protein
MASDGINSDDKVGVQLICSKCEADGHADDTIQCPIDVLENETGWDYRGNQNDSPGKQRYYFYRTLATAVELHIRRPYPPCLAAHFVEQGLGSSQKGFKPY